MAKARVFISYAHEDKEWVLEGPGNIHLIPRIKRHVNSDAEIWFDEGLVIGEKWDEEIYNHDGNNIRSGNYSKRPHDNIC